MNINHNPIFDTDKIAALYTEKDGVPVKYVCTSALNENSAVAVDIFYRDTPHPTFGNRYFTIFNQPSLDGESRPMIAGADQIEKLTFGLIECDNGWEYSQHRHDYRKVGQKMIDGGRAYIRTSSTEHEVMKIVDGEFVHN